MAESNKMKDMPVQMLMVAVGIGTGVGEPMHFLQEHWVRETVKKQQR